MPPYGSTCRWRWPHSGSLPQAFFQRVAQGYAERAALAPQRFVRIDGAQPLAQVQQQVFAALRQRGWLEEAAP